MTKISDDFNLYVLIRGNKAQQQKTVHSSMAYYVHVRLYTAAKQICYYIISYNNLELIKYK